MSKKRIFLSKEQITIINLNKDVNNNVDLKLLQNNHQKKIC